jgi:hypothetical protein
MRNFVAMLCIAVLAGCGSGEPTVEVTMAPSQYSAGQYRIIATSLVEDVTVTAMTVNRGNCRITTPNLPKKLGFGDTLESYISNCNVKEVEVQMEDEAFTFAFE